MIATSDSLYWKRITIPKGLPALLEIFAKETIRENPKNIVQFLSTLIDDLIAKRDQEKGEGSAEKDNLLKKGNRKNSYTFTDEELAACKIQAGFRGYKTRKSLKSKKRKAGHGLSLTSLTSLIDNDEKIEANSSEEDVLERKRVEKEVDEAIAAEIKTPLETIREESIDGSFRVKTPDVKHSPVDVLDNSSSKISQPPKPTVKDMADEILEELSEELHNLLEAHENLSEELELVGNNNLSLDDVKTESMELEVELEQNPDEGPNIKLDEEESDADREMMDQHVIEVLNSQDLGEDDPTSTSQSLGATDVKGASLEIHESEVETMLLEEDSVANAEVHGGESELGENYENPPAKIEELLENPADCVEKENTEITTELGRTNSHDIVEMNEADTKNLETLEFEQSAKKVESMQNNLSTENLPDSIVRIASATESPSQSEHDKETETGKSEDVAEQNTGNSGNNEFINEDTAVEIDKNDLNDVESQNETKQSDIPKLHPDSIVDVEMPSLFLCEESSYTTNATDSASISSSVTTIRPLAFQKHEDSSQDASSLSESPAAVPRPKPRKPISVSFEENKSFGDEPVTAARNLSSELMEESSSESLPVMRRQKSSPKTRGRAVSSKYRSGIVMDEEVSMEEMEAQIENDMLSQAATRIQAGFRGYKTRKNMGVSGNDKKRAKLMSSSKNANAAAADPAASVAPTTPPTSDSVASTEFAASESGFAPASTSSDSLDYYITDQDKPARPTLAYLRSRSYPGSHEKEEDSQSGGGRGHSRGTKASSADGAAAAIAADALDNHPHGPTASTPELEYDPAYVNNAAIKIQASVRGFLVRKHSKRGDSRKKGEITGSTQSTNNPGEIPRVQFDVGDLEHGDEAFIEFHPDSSPTSGRGSELIVNPAEDRAWRDSASPISDVGSDVAAIKIQAAYRGFKDRQKVRHAKKAVVTIQATVRGFLTRRRLMKLRRRSLQSRRRSSAKSLMMSPEVQKMKKANDAAIKIQAVYRGYQVRSKIRKVGSDDEQN